MSDSERKSRKCKSRKRIVDPGSLATKPSCKTFIKMEGSKHSFSIGRSAGSKSTGSSVKSVGRISAEALSDLANLAKEDNKKARVIAITAVHIASVAKRQTVSIEHMQIAKTIVDMVSKLLKD